MTGNEIYKRTAAYEKETSSIRLHAPHWKLLLAFDGQRSLSEVALSVETSFAEALPLTEEFLRHGWVEEQPISLEQYLKRTGAASVSAIGAAIPPPVVLHAPATEAAMAPKPEAAAPVILPPPLAATPPLPAGPLRLGAVVDFIVEQAHSLALGQIAVYRVFLRVPPTLLQEEDIVSVHLAGDPTLVKSAPLKQSIAEAVLEVLKKPLPAGAFAAA